MNLADAIRRAAHASGASFGQPEPRTQETVPVATTPTEVVINHTPAAEEPKMEFESKPAEPEAGHSHEKGHVVRLELVLTPEQLKGLFGAVVANQHSVMTLREAANYLRISAPALEDLANGGEVPGMLVDSKWRFTREGLDDWLNTHSRRKEA